MTDASKFLLDSKMNIQLPGENDYFLMQSSRPLSPLPNDCIDQIYKEESPTKGSNSHIMLE